MNSFSRTLGFIHQHPLAKKNLFQAYWNFISWQVKSRVRKNKFFVIPFVNKTRMLAKNGLNGITGNIYTGLHEFEEMSFLLHFLQPSDVFFDVGANVGSYTILAAGVSKSKCLSFEPSESAFEILNKNVLLNKVEGLVWCQNMAVGNSSGFMNFTTGQDTTNHIVTEANMIDSFERIVVTRLDNFYPDYDPSLIKIDVEGFETEVLNGAGKILESPSLKAIIIELNGSGERYNYKEEDIHQKLTGYNFSPYRYDAFSRKLFLQAGFGSHNTIYIRDVEFVMNRIEKAAYFQVFNTKI